MILHHCLLIKHPTFSSFDLLAKLTATYINSQSRCALSEGTSFVRLYLTRRWCHSLSGKPAHTTNGSFPPHFFPMNTVQGARTMAGVWVLKATTLLTLHQATAALPSMLPGVESKAATRSACRVWTKVPAWPSPMPCRLSESCASPSPRPTRG